MRSLAWHGPHNLDERPAAADMAREAAELAAHRAHLGAQQAAHIEHELAHEVGRAALDGAGHAAARRVADDQAAEAARAARVAAARDGYRRG